jgi:hypothetical protein
VVSFSRDTFVELAVGHETHELSTIGGLHNMGGDVVSVPKHCDPVANLEDLIEPVRYVNDRDTSRRETANREKRFFVSVTVSAEVGSSMMRIRGSRDRAFAISIS